MNPNHLEQAAKDFAQACNDRDPDRIVSFLAEDAVAMYPHPLPTYGREASRKAWANVFEPPDATHPVTADEVSASASNDLGYSLGRWWYIHPGAGAHVGGRYLACWRLVKGEWLIHHLSANVHEDISVSTPENGS